MRVLFYRARLLLLACMAALGGAVGAAGKASWLWVAIPGAMLCAAAVVARRHGNRAVWAVACLVFLCAGLYVGHARFANWRGRGGTAGDVHLVGVVEVGCRGKQGDIVDLFRVTVAGQGTASREGDRYLLRYQQGENLRAEWGDTLEVEGSLFLFEREGGGVGGSLVADECTVLSHSGNPLLRLATTYRDLLREQVRGELEPAQAGLIEGMVLGDYRKLGARDLKAFRLTGLIHLCAASGLNLAILAGFVVWLGRRARLSHRMILAIQVPILIVYALAVGLSVPIIRATVVALLAATAYFLGRDFDLLPAMGMAVFYLLWSDPGAAAGVSFQLCFSAAAGMVVFYRPLSALLRAGGSKIMALVAATLAAQLAVGPILLYHFGEVSLLATLSNILVLPLVPAVMALAMLASLTGAAGLSCAGALMRAAGFLTQGILVVARTLAGPSWASLRIFPFPFLWIVVYYPALVAALLARGRWRRLGRVVVTVLLTAALLCGITLPLRPLGADAGMRITIIDVGQGDAILVQAPSGATVLVDGGMDERVLAADLRSRGVVFIDAIVVSHPDADHIGGLDGAIDNCEVAMLVHPATKETGQAGKFLARAEEMGVEVQTMRAGDSLQLGEIGLSAYGPPREVPEEISTNEYSLVMRLEGPGFSMLLTGDIEEEGEGMLMGYAKDQDLACDILKVPHHGGFCEVNEEFFSKVDPCIAVISVGAGNPFGHPAKATVEALQRGGCGVYRTDQSGDIVIRVVEGGYRVECERSSSPRSMGE
ncbi:MAG: DNA internalization-related competence protein ComEC/Rec2 [Actinobacteria bacterium]|jgi:competence protein ComEC|nr:MAG: DNA internalization-related competence protein ComEC/Rec2 [Actinomycetota bacterium]